MKALSGTRIPNTLAALTLAAAIAACQKKDAAPEANPPSTSSQPATAAPARVAAHAAPVFDTLGTTVYGDLNGDGNIDTVTPVHLGAAAAAAVQSAYKVVVPDSSGRTQDHAPWDWGLAVRLGTGTAAPKHDDSLFIPEIPSVIYNQGGVDIVRIDTLQYPAVKDGAGENVHQAIAMFTEAGIMVYLFYGHDRFRMFWPDEEADD